MVNVLSDQGGLFDAAKELGGFRRNKNVAAIKARNAARISKGRPGFPQPINLNPPGLSQKARQINDSIRVGGTALLQSLLDLSAYNQEGQILLIQQRATSAIIDTIEQTQEVVGEGIDIEA